MSNDWETYTDDWQFDLERVAFSIQLEADLEGYSLPVSRLIYIYWNCAGLQDASVGPLRGLWPTDQCIAESYAWLKDKCDPKSLVYAMSMWLLDRLSEIPEDERVATK